MTHSFKKWLVIFWSCSSCVLTYSQDTNSFRYLSKKDGLSQVSVFAIAQDKAGFMWFGTRDGINKYDGYQFKIYKNDSSVNSLASNDVRVIYQDAFSSDLWVGTLDGLSRYRPPTDDFENFKNSVSKNSLSSNVIHAIFKDDQSQLWVGTAASLNLFDPKSGNLSGIFGVIKKMINFSIQA